MNTLKIFTNKYSQNFFFLCLYQGVNFIALIIFLPFLTKILGIEKFGLITVMQVVCNFFFIVVDYGFSVTSVRKLSLAKKDDLLVENIIRNTLCTKALLVVLSFPLFVITCMFFLKGDYNFYFIVMSFFAIVGQSIFPSWLCQGLEEAKLLFWANFANKILLLVLVWSFISKQDDYVYYLFFTGISSIYTGLIAIWFLLKFRLRMSLNKTFIISEIFNELNAGKEIFLSNFSISIYLNANTLILSLFASPYIIGLYGIAERIVTLLRALLSVFVQVIYPLVCRLTIDFPFREVVRKTSFVTIPFIIGILFLCISISYFNLKLAMCFTLNGVQETASLIKKMSFLPLLVSMNIIPNLVILAYGKDKIKSYMLIFSTFLSLTLSIKFIPLFKVDGAIAIMYTIEIVTSILSIYYLLRLNYLESKALLK